MPTDITSIKPAPKAESTTSGPLGERLAALPILMLNVHEQCNCRCVMCDIWQREGGKELDLSQFARHREHSFALASGRLFLPVGAAVAPQP